MDIQVNYNYKKELLHPIAITELAEFVLERQKLPDFTEVVISFVKDEDSAFLNEKYRDRTGPTDVLSFACDSDSVEDEPDGFTDPDPNNQDFQTFMLGDIVIAVDIAIRQTVEYGTTLEEEISLLVIHGLLHLCGYDHIYDAEAKVMEALEDGLLSDWFKGKGN